MAKYSADREAWDEAAECSRREACEWPSQSCLYAQYNVPSSYQTSHPHGAAELPRQCFLQALTAEVIFKPWDSGKLQMRWRKDGLF